MAASWLAIATVLAATPAFAFAKASAGQTTQPAEKGHSGKQSITVLTGNSQPAHPNLVPIDPPGGGGIGGPPSGDPPAPQITLRTFDLNTHSHQATIILSNGFRAVIDANRRTITMAYDGQTATVTLDAALLQWANGNAALANQRKQALLKMLHSKIDNSRLAKLDSASPDTYFTPSSRGGWVPNSIHVRTNVIALPPTRVIASPLPPFSCWAIWSCFYRPLPPQSWQPDDFLYGFWFQSGGTAPPNPEHPDDYHAWRKLRDAACASATGNAIAAAAGIGAFSMTWKGALAGSEWGPPEWIGAGIVLAGELAVVGYSTAMHNHNERICKSNYPGYGKW